MKEDKNPGVLYILLVPRLLFYQQQRIFWKIRKRKKEELNHLRLCKLGVWLKEKPEISFLPITVGLLKLRLSAVNNKFHQNQLTDISQVVQKI